jgi:hypothetical protein
MSHFVSNLLFRHKDPTRDWVADPDALIIDIRRCTLAGTALGADFRELRKLGPTENARKTVRGIFEWYSKGIYCRINNQKLSDFTAVLSGSDFMPFAGRFVVEDKPVAVSAQSTPEAIMALLGEPFGRSDQEESTLVLFYEFECGEVQFAFNKDLAALETIEFWFSPELADQRAREAYGIPDPFPDAFHRSLNA